MVENIAKIEFLRGNRLWPSFTLDSRVLEEANAPLMGALVVKLLSKDIEFMAMRERLKRLWKPSGGFELMDLGHGFYLLKFDLEEDKSKVLDGGPWMLFDHYLSVRFWTPQFVASLAPISKTRFPCLNLGYYDEKIMKSLANIVGKQAKVDIHTIK